MSGLELISLKTDLIFLLFLIQRWANSTWRFADKLKYNDEIVYSALMNSFSKSILLLNPNLFELFLAF
jgi:hypothetical protein